ncbi:MAG TPA: AzlD domain-containing protein [Solirubrobacterales bacterium]|nr:AzlD domain-containing protein [Solirubrobacterales bacterium]
MSAGWATIIALAVTAALVRAAGPVAFGGRPLPGRLQDVIPLLAPALLAALVVTETVGGEDGLAVDERLAGVAAAGLVLARRPESLLPAIALAAVVTAGLRLAL